MAAILRNLCAVLCFISATDAMYNFNVSSQVINDTRIRGFRDTIDKDFVLGGLFPVHDGIGCTNLRLQRGLERLEAMLFAIDRINNDTTLLPNLTIGYDVRDSCGDETVGLDEALDMVVRSGSLTIDTSMQCMQSGNSSTPLSGIVGAASSAVTLPTATLLGLRIFQTPLVSYASSSAALSNKNLYQYFLRTIPPDNLQSNAMVDMALYFGWRYMSVVFNDNAYGEPGTDAFIEKAMEKDICIDVRMGILPLQVTSAERFNETITDVVKALINSTATVVVVFTDETTVLALFEELSRTNRTRGKEFLWIASDAWAGAASVRDRFPEIANGTFAFQPSTLHVEQFTDYFSQLNLTNNIRDPFFPEYYAAFCGDDGNNCSNGLTNNPSYSQGNIVPLIIDAVYVFAQALQNFLDFNCGSPLVWNRATRECNNMTQQLTGENLLDYLFNVSFNGIQNRSVSFDRDGDPPGIYEITQLQVDGYVLVGFWDSAQTDENRLILNNNSISRKVESVCSRPCGEGMIESVTNQNCPACFECIPCVGPTYSANITDGECSMCDNNHWGNSPFTGSTHCVPVEVTHLEFSSGWAIASMCIASIALILLVIITVIFAVTWKTPVVKSSGREQMVMLLIGIGLCYILTYVVVSPPSITICTFQRIGVWFCFSLAFGALLVKIVRVARIFYWRSSVVKRPPFTDPKHQVIFTLLIVAGQMLLVVIALGVDPPIVNRSPDVVRTSEMPQTGGAPEIIETCQQPHTALLILSLVYNFFILIGCTILGWMTRRLPGNFNEARHVMFTSFTIMAVWVLFVPLYFSTEDEFQIGVLALGVTLSAVALMCGVFFPKVFIIVFQKKKNTKEYATQQQNQGAIIGGSTAFTSQRQINIKRDAFTSRHVTSSVSIATGQQLNGVGSNDSGITMPDENMKMNTLKGRDYRPECNSDSTNL